MKPSGWRNVQGKPESLTVLFDSRCPSGEYGPARPTRSLTIRRRPNPPAPPMKFASKWLADPAPAVQPEKSSLSAQCWTDRLRFGVIHDHAFNLCRRFGCYLRRLGRWRVCSAPRPTLALTLHAQRFHSPRRSESLQSPFHADLLFDLNRNGEHRTLLFGLCWENVELSSSSRLTLSMWPRFQNPSATSLAPLSLTVKHSAADVATRTRPATGNRQPCDVQQLNQTHDSDLRNRSVLHLESQPKDDKPGEKRAEPGGFVFDFDEALNLSFQPRTRKIA